MVCEIVIDEDTAGSAEQVLTPCNAVQAGERIAQATGVDTETVHGGGERRRHVRQVVTPDQLSHPAPRGDAAEEEIEARAGVVGGARRDEPVRRGAERRLPLER